MKLVNTYSCCVTITPFYKGKSCNMFIRDAMDQQECKEKRLVKRDEVITVI